MQPCRLVFSIVRLIGGSCSAPGKKIENLSLWNNFGPMGNLLYGDEMARDQRLITLRTHWISFLMKNHNHK